MSGHYNKSELSTIQYLDVPPQFCGIDSGSPASILLAVWALSHLQQQMSCGSTIWCLHKDAWLLQPCLRFRQWGTLNTLLLGWRMCIPMCTPMCTMPHVFSDTSLYTRLRRQLWSYIPKIEVCDSMLQEFHHVELFLLAASTSKIDDLYHFAKIC